MKTGKHPYVWSLILVGLVVFWPSSIPAERLIAVLQALPGLTA